MHKCFFHRASVLTLISQDHMETFIWRIVAEPCSLLICSSLTYRFHLIAVGKHLVLSDTGWMFSSLTLLNLQQVQHFLVSLFETLNDHTPSLTLPSAEQSSYLSLCITGFSFGPKRYIHDLFGNPQGLQTRAIWPLLVVLSFTPLLFQLVLFADQKDQRPLTQILSYVLLQDCLFYPDLACLKLVFAPSTDSLQRLT